MTLPWEDSGCETHEYRSPAGESVKFRTLVGSVGRMMPPVANTTMAIPQGHGSRYLGSAHLERMVALPVAVPGVFDGRDELRRWAGVLDPTAGEGTLSVVNGVWAGRQLRCVYDTGLDELEETSPRVFSGVLVFRAAWPYWVDSTESSTEVGQGDTGQTWFPFLPLILGASDAFGVVTIINDGDAPAWPRITMAGPGQETEIRNDTTGKVIHVAGTIDAGSVLDIDTRPGKKTVRIDGVNAYSRLTDESSLWSLVPGPNRVVLAAALTSVDTSITFSWRRQWLAA